MAKRWTKWKKFPDPEKMEMLTAPIGPGIYELRLKGSPDRILVGIGRCCAYRMSSLLPQGAGTRRNSDKRKLVGRDIRRLEYRTKACSSRMEAKSIEKVLLSKFRYEFPT